MEKSIWLWIFLGSLSALAFIALRNRIGWGWIGKTTVHLIIAMILLYFVGLAEPYTNLHLPMNAVTITTVAILGIPGLAMLAGLKLLVVV